MNCKLLRNEVRPQSKRSSNMHVKEEEEMKGIENEWNFHALTFMHSL